LAAQAVPHMPQFVVLVWMLTHCPEQLVVPTGHLQAPPWQDDPPVQVTPHPPQLLLSFCGSTHEPPQSVRLDAHWPWQTPTLQTWFEAHAVAHWPQWVGSVCVLTHEPEQYAMPSPH